MPKGIQIDPANGGEFAAQYSNMQQGPFPFAGALYSVLTTDTACEVAKSTDNGKTWNLMDAAGEPSDPALSSAAYWFDGVQTVYVAYSLGAHVQAPIELISYDLATDTWSAPFVTVGSIDVGTIWAICQRSDGTLVVISGSVSSGPIPSGLAASVWLGGAWIGNFDLAGDPPTEPGIYALAEYSADVAVSSFAACTDGIVDTLYCFFQTADTSIGHEMQNGVFFTWFTVANTLANFFVFPGQIGSPPPDPQDLQAPEGAVFGFPALCGSTNLVLPVARNNPAVLPSEVNYPTLYSSPDGGLTWFEATGAGMDPAAFARTTSDNVQFAPMAFWDGVNLTCVYAALVPPPPPSESNIIRICVTTPGSFSAPDGWSWADADAAKISDLTGTTGFSFPKWTFQGMAILSTDAVTLPADTLSAWFVGPGTNTGRIHGTFTGFVKSGQFSGGNK